MKTATTNTTLTEGGQRDSSNELKSFGDLRIYEKYLPVFGNF